MAVVRNHPRGIIISALLTWLLSAAIVVVILMTPTFLQKVYGFDPLSALQANSLATLTLSIGCVMAGAIVDRIGAGRFFVVGTLFLAVTTYALYSLLFTHKELLLPLYALAGFAVGTIGAVPYVLVKSFPPAVRFSGVSFSYNIAYAVFGGLTPMLVTLWLQADPLAPAHYVLAICAIGFATGLYLLKRGI